MSESRHQVLIIGGGTAGITTAARLTRSGKKLDIAVIEPSDKHFYQPLWTLVGAGIVPKEITVRKEASVMPKGVTWIRDAVVEIDPDANQVRTAGGRTIGYDYLVVAPGIQYDWDAVKGLRETLGKNGVVSNYTFETAEKTWEAMKNFEGGTAVFTNPLGQVKCGGAPQKVMYLADDYWRRNGVRGKTKMIGAFAGTVMLGVPEINKSLERIVRQRDIEMRFYHNLVEVRTSPKKEAVFDVRDPKTGETTHQEVIPFDFLHATPPMKAPDFVAASPLAVPEGPHKGYVDVDIHTLQHKRYPNVFSLGDAAALPTAKTGAAVRKQAPKLVKNLLAVMEGKPAEAKYNGYSSCPIVTARGRVLLGEFLYDNKYKPPFVFLDQTKERWDMWLLKRYVLPPLYWYGMLKGLA